MPNKRLQHYFFDARFIDLNVDDIKVMKRFSAEEDALWGHDEPRPYTAIKMKDGAKTSENVGTAYVRETPEEILSLPVIQ